MATRFAAARHAPALACIRRDEADGAGMQPRGHSYRAESIFAESFEVFVDVVYEIGRKFRVIRDQRQTRLACDSLPHRLFDSRADDLLFRTAIELGGDLHLALQLLAQFDRRLGHAAYNAARSARADGAARSKMRRSTAHCFALLAGSPARPAQPRDCLHWLLSSEWWQLAQLMSENSGHLSPRAWRARLASESRKAMACPAAHAGTPCVSLRAVQCAGIVSL